MKALCVVFGILVLITLAYAQTAGFVVEPLQNGERARAFSTAGWPTDSPRIGALVGVEAQAQANTNDGGSASLDVSYFVLNTINQVGFGYAYYHAEASVPSISTNNGTFVGNFAQAGFACGIRFHGLVEYIENNGQPGLQDGDTILPNGYNLNTNLLFIGWNPWVIETDNLGNGVYMYTVTAQTSDNVFLIRVRAVTEPVLDETNDIRLNPDASKIDIEINYYNNPLYTAASFHATGPSDATEYPNARVALVTTVGGVAAQFKYDTETKVGPGNGGSVTLGAAAAGFTGFFNWETTAVTGAGAAAAVHATASYPTSAPAVANSVQSAATGVGASFDAGWAGGVMVFAYDEARPTSILWDPELGSQNPYIAGSSAAASLSILTFAIVALIALLF